MWSIHSINKNKGLLQWESIKTLTLGVYQISYHSRISLDSNRRQQRQRINLFDVCFLGIYERHAGFLADSVVFVNFHVFLVLVAAKRDFCANVLETQVGKYLASSQLHYIHFGSASTMSTCKCLLTDFAFLGHAIIKTDVLDEFECHLKCMGNSGASHAMFILMAVMVSSFVIRTRKPGR